MFKFTATPDQKSDRRSIGSVGSDGTPTGKMIRGIKTALGSIGGVNLSSELASESLGPVDPSPDILNKAEKIMSLRLLLAKKMVRGETVDELKVKLNEIKLANERLQRDLSQSNEESDQLRRNASKLQYDLSDKDAVVQDLKTETLALTDAKVLLEKLVKKREAQMAELTKYAQQAIENARLLSSQLISSKAGLPVGSLVGEIRNQDEILKLREENQALISQHQQDEITISRFKDEIAVAVERIDTFQQQISRARQAQVESEVKVERLIEQLQASKRTNDEQIKEIRSLKDSNRTLKEQATNLALAFIQLGGEEVGDVEQSKLLRGTFGDKAVDLAESIVSENSVTQTRMKPLGFPGKQQERKYTSSLSTFDEESDPESVEREKLATTNLVTFKPDNEGELISNPPATGERQGDLDKKPHAMRGRRIISNRTKPGSGKSGDAGEQTDLI